MPSASYSMVHRWMRWYCVSHMYKWDPQFCVYFFFFHVCLQFSSPMLPSLNTSLPHPEFFDILGPWIMDVNLHLSFTCNKMDLLLAGATPKGRHFGYPELRWIPMTLYWHYYVCRQESLQIDGISWVLEEVPVYHQDWFGIKE